MVKIPMPHCAVCGREVAELVRWDDPEHRGVIFEARCHGAREKTIFTHSDLKYMRLDPQPGIAFVQAKALVDG